MKEAGLVDMSFVDFMLFETESTHSKVRTRPLPRPFHRLRST